MKLLDFLLHLLVRDGDRLGLHPKAQDGLRTALDEMFASGRNARAEAEELLRAAWRFEERGDFEVADGIFEALATAGRALILLGIPSPAAREREKQLAAFADTKPKRAPEYDAPAPQGSVKLHALPEVRRHPRDRVRS